MKIAYISIGILFGCYITVSSASEHEKVVKHIAALSLSASPSGVIPPSTPPIPTSMVSPYREPFIEGAAEFLERLAEVDASKKRSFRLSKGESIIVENVPQDRSPIRFAKMSIPKELLEDEKERPLSAGVDSHENDQGEIFTMDDEV